MKQAGLDLLWCPQSLCFLPFERVNAESPEAYLQGLLRLKLSEDAAQRRVPWVGA